MIHSVSGFFPNVISRSSPPLRQSNVSQSSAVFSPANDNNAQARAVTRASFTSGMPLFFALSPSEFSVVFSGTTENGFSGKALAQAASAAYTQSSLLTANRLSVSV